MQGAQRFAMLDRMSNHPAVAAAYRAARIGVLALACTYIAATAYKLSGKYGTATDAAIATIGELNSDTYDVLWAIAGQFGISTDHGRRAMRDIIICSPDRPRTLDEMALYTKAREAVKFQFIQHSGYAYLTLKAAIESGARNIKVDLQRAYPQYRLYDVHTPEKLVCTRNAENEIMREIDRMPPSVYYSQSSRTE